MLRKLLFGGQLGKLGVGQYGDQMADIALQALETRAPFDTRLVHIEAAVHLDLQGLDLGAAIIDGVKRSLGLRGRAAEGAPRWLAGAPRRPILS